MTDKTAALQVCLAAIEQVKDALVDADDREVLEFAATLARAALALDARPRADKRPLVGLDLLDAYGVAEPGPRPWSPPVSADVISWPEVRERAPAESTDAKPGASQKEPIAAEPTARRRSMLRG
jgi:hypothetical protein